jgi:hypothetical protein
LLTLLLLLLLLKRFRTFEPRSLSATIGMKLRTTDSCLLMAWHGNATCFIASRECGRLFHSASAKNRFAPAITLILHGKLRTTFGFQRRICKGARGGKLATNSPRTITKRTQRSLIVSLQSQARVACCSLQPST